MTEFHLKSSLEKFDSRHSNQSMDDWQIINHEPQTRNALTKDYFIFSVSSLKIENHLPFLEFLLYDNFQDPWYDNVDKVC